MAAEEEDGWEPLEPPEAPERAASADWPEPGDAPPTTDAVPPDARLDAAFAALLRALRAIPGPCAPPIGAGAFDILYASEREVVVWYAPARDGVEQREVAIPGALLRAAWALALRGEPVAEPALRALAPGAAGGRWLLSLLAQVPGMETRHEPLVEEHGPEGPAHGSEEANGSGDEPRVTLTWRGER